MLEIITIKNILVRLKLTQTVLMNEYIKLLRSLNHSIVGWLGTLWRFKESLLCNLSGSLFSNLNPDSFARRLNDRRKANCRGVGVALARNALEMIQFSS